MLYFCEDCGEKNFLEPGSVQNGKVTFRCRFCNYLNNFQAAAPEDTDKPAASLVDKGKRKRRGKPSSSKKK